MMVSERRFSNREWGNDVWCYCNVTAAASKKVTSPHPMATGTQCTCSKRKSKPGGRSGRPFRAGFIGVVQKR